MKIMVIMVIIMVQRIIIFSRIELNIPNLKISWQIQQMLGIGTKFL